MTISAKQAAGYLDAICKLNILVVGDVMLDRFIDGKVERISPEAPVPVLSQTKSATMPGGAANVARNICQLGAHCTLIGITGKDEAASQLASALATIAGLDFKPIALDGRPTTTKTRFRAGTQQILRLDDEVTTPLSDAQVNDVYQMAQAHIAKADLIILSDYAKGCLAPSLIEQLITAADKAGKKVIIDPKSHDFTHYAGAFLVTPNLSELTKAAQLQSNDDDAIADAANSLCNTHNISHMLTTLSARGMRLDGNGMAHHIPSVTKDVFDVSGAGDTVVASLVLAYGSGADLKTAMAFANQAASIVVSKAGTAAYSAGEFIACCEPNTPPSTSLDAQMAQIQSWRDEGLKIGFTNGCFDMLHSGHLHVLRQARTHCDRLIVGLNSNESVRTLKGPTRPMQGEDVRAFVLAQLAYCDAVILFDDETPLALIAQIDPDVLIKGGDYQLAEIVGYDHVTKKGGTVLTIPLLEGHSTTAFLAQ